MRRAASVCVLGWLLAACDDDGVLRAFEPRTVAPSTSGGSVADAGTGGGGSGGSPSNGAAGAGAPSVTTPLLIDDFEDGDTRAKEPLGWWYPVNDGTATQGYGIEPVARSETSVYVLRTHGSGFQDWGAAVGVNLLSGDVTPLNAKSDEQLCFVARVETGTSTQVQVHFVVTGGERHFIREISLSDAWSRYCLPLSGFLSGQEPLVPTGINALQFFFAPRERFELWLDDVEIAR
jgi:hypothetical protein